MICLSSVKTEIIEFGLDRDDQVQSKPKPFKIKFGEPVWETFKTNSHNVQKKKKKKTES